MPVEVQLLTVGAAEPVGPLAAGPALAMAPRGVGSGGPQRDSDPQVQPDHILGGKS